MDQLNVDSYADVDSDIHAVLFKPRYGTRFALVNLSNKFFTQSEMLTTITNSTVI